MLLRNVKLDEHVNDPIFTGPTFCSARAKLITSWAPKSNQKNGWAGVSEIKTLLGWEAARQLLVQLTWVRLSATQ